MGSEKYDEGVRLFNEARIQYEEFVSGKKIAATRGRQLLQKIKRLAQDCRIEIQQVRKQQQMDPNPEK